MPRPPQLSSCLLLPSLSLPPPHTHAPVFLTDFDIVLMCNNHPSPLLSEGSEKQQHRVGEHRPASATTSDLAHVPTEDTLTPPTYPRTGVCTHARVHSQMATQHRCGRGNGLILLKALKEKKRFPSARAIREPHRGPVSWACAPSASQPPRAQVTGAITLLPSSEQRNWELC